MFDTFSLQYLGNSLDDDHLGLTRLRLKGLSGARDEFLLAATVQNLRRLANLIAIPPPRPMIA